jgi:PTH1 family peptidyl-tRNA hydrolase
MFLIIALGNPGKEYKRTRHNAGWLFVDDFYKNFKNEFDLGEWVENKKFNAMICEGRAPFDRAQGDKKIILAKPLTFMNESGRTVSAILNFYKGESTTLIVVHDDIDLAFGTFKMQQNISSAGHHGVESIIAAMGSQDFWRLRLGIKKDVKTETTKFVLNNFSLFERPRLNKVFADAKKSLLDILQQ